MILVGKAPFINTSSNSLIMELYLDASLDDLNFISSAASLSRCNITPNPNSKAIITELGRKYKSFAVKET